MHCLNIYNIKFSKRTCWSCNHKHERTTSNNTIAYFLLTGISRFFFFLLFISFFFWLNFRFSPQKDVCFLNHALRNFICAFLLARFFLLGNQVRSCTFLIFFLHFSKKDVKTGQHIEMQYFLFFINYCFFVR